MRARLCLSAAAGAAFALTGLAADPAALPTAPVVSSIHAGPLTDEFRLTLSSGSRFEALGPLYYSQQVDETTTWGLPPFFSHHQDKGTDSEEIDVLYPLISYDRFGLEHRWHVLQLLAFSGGQNVDGGKRDRFQLFPFYLQQRSAEDPSRNYTSVLPFYGTMQNKLFRDRIHFVAFPLYVETQKRDVVTKNYVAPFFHLRTGDHLSGWQFWPLYGTEHKDAFTRTNSVGDAEVSPGHDKQFGLWPLYSSAHTGIGSDNPESSLSILPFGAWQRSPKRDSTTYLWPFFSAVDDREKGYREWGTPWPFIVTSKGKGKQGFRFWPIYGHAQNDSLESRTLLYPLLRQTSAKSPAYERSRTRGLMLLYSDLREKDKASNRDRRRVDCWPFFTWKRDWDGAERLQALALMEPFVPTSKSVERNHSHVWSIYRSESNPKTGQSSRSVLWNLYRQERSPEGSKRSFLFGLYQSETSGGERSRRLFYLPLGPSKTRNTDPAASKPAAVHNP